ncbi:MAG: hypothetical protein J2P24_04995 [Streptosporangiales bacterium]|nr:hypothetical protein [Streptosporangiales bacterium]MBO0890283.1 hypothetical protein [Acidothermales bacterium]
METFPLTVEDDEITRNDVADDSADLILRRVGRLGLVTRPPTAWSRCSSTDSDTPRSVEE